MNPSHLPLRHVVTPDLEARGSDVLSGSDCQIRQLSGTDSLLWHDEGYVALVLWSPKGAGPRSGRLVAS